MIQEVKIFTRATGVTGQDTKLYPGRFRSVFNIPDTTQAVTAAALAFGIDLGIFPASVIKINKAYYYISGYTASTGTAPYFGIGTTVGTGAVTTLHATPGFHNLVREYAGTVWGANAGAAGVTRYAGGPMPSFAAGKLTSILAHGSQDYAIQAASEPNALGFKTAVEMDTTMDVIVSMQSAIAGIDMTAGTVHGYFNIADTFKGSETAYMTGIKVVLDWELLGDIS